MMISPVPFGPYDLGNTTVYSARSDARFSYCLFVPSNFSSRSTAAELLVAVHGTPRTFMDFREMFADFAERNNVIVLSPLFPVGVNGDGNADGYKYIEEQGLRYDAVLLDIVGKFAPATGWRTSVSPCSASRAEHSLPTVFCCFGRIISGLRR